MTFQWNYESPRNPPTGSPDHPSTHEEMIQETRERLGEASRACHAGIGMTREDMYAILDERDSLIANLVRTNTEYTQACKLVADMHAAATGAHGASPKRGVIEDVADLRAEMLRLRDANEVRRARGVSTDKWTKDVLRRLSAIRETGAHDAYDLIVSLTADLKKSHEEIWGHRQNEKRYVGWAEDMIKRLKDSGAYDSPASADKAGE